MDVADDVVAVEVYVVTPLLAKLPWGMHFAELSPAGVAVEVERLWAVEE